MSPSRFERKVLGIDQREEHYIVSVSLVNDGEFEDAHGLSSANATIIIPRKIGDGMTYDQLADEALGRFEAAKNLL